MDKPYLENVQFFSILPYALQMVHTVLSNSHKLKIRLSVHVLEVTW